MVKIITFYSYKGGVGRSQLLANMASYLAIYKNKKILMIDWDLEAPGLDSFFKLDKNKINFGLIDLFHDYTQKVRTDDDIEIDELPSISEKYIVPVFEDRIWLLPAGGYANNYNQKVRTFNWDEFYNTLSGKMYIEFLKDELKKSDFDYIFIDSRTGINDYSGICNIQMPDANILVVAPTMQNIEGASEMASTIINSPYTREEFRTPIVIPLLSRLDTTETEAALWFEKFRERFFGHIDNFIKHLVGNVEHKLKLTNDFIEKTLLEYKTGISFGEKVLFTDKSLEIKPITLENKFQEIAEIIEILNKGFNHGKSDFVNILRKEKIKIPKNLTLVPEINVEEIIGRQEIVNELCDLLRNSEKPVLVNGLGGLGKTTLAKAVLHQIENDYKHIVWVDASSGIVNSIVFNETLQNNLGEKLDKESQNDPGLLFKTFVRISSKLRNLEGPNLLIIDNAGNDIEDAQIFNQLNLYPDWRILATSRQQLKGFSTFYLNVLPPDIAKQIFKHYYRAEVNDNDLQELLELIGYHTLTIELLAKTLDENFAIEGIRELINYIKNNKLKDEEWQISINIPTSDKERSIFRHLTNAFKLGGMSETEKWILIQFSVLPSMDIHGKDLIQFLNIKADKKKEFVSGLKSLTEKGWLQARNKHYFYAHPIIKEVIRYKLRPDANKCRQLIQYHIKALTIKPEENPIDKKAYIPFAENIVNHILTYDNDIAALASLLGYLYIYLGDYQKSLDYNQHAIKIREKILEPKHLDLASSYNNIAYTYYNLKNFEKALTYNQKALSIREEKLSPEHPDLALSYNNIAGAYSNLEDFEKSIFYHEKAINILENVLEDKHPDLAQTFNNIAVTYSNIGDFEKSLHFDKRAIEIRENVLDENHPDLALSYYNIAATYKDLQQFDKALEYDFKALSIREKIHKKNHPSLAQSYNNIAVTYHNIGDYEKALEYHQKAITIQENDLSDLHSDLALSYHNIAGTYYNMKNYDEALSFNHKALNIREKCEPIPISDIIASRNNLANTYFKLGDYDKAIKYYELSIDLMKKTKDTDTQSLGLVYSNISACYYFKEEYKKAIEFGEQTISCQKQFLMEDAEELGWSYHNLAIAYYKANNYKEAKKYIDSALAIKRKALPENHPEIKESLDYKDDIEKQID